VPLTPDDWTASTLTVPYRLVGLRLGVANIIAVDVGATAVIVGADVVHEARVMNRKSRTDFRFLSKNMMQRPFHGEYTVCVMEVPLKMRSSSKLRISHVMGDSLLLDLSQANYYVSLTGQQAPRLSGRSSLVELTKILHGQRGLLD